MVAQNILRILLICLVCTVVIYCRPTIDTSEIVKDIRDIENILNEADNDNGGDNDEDSNDSTASDKEEEEETDKDESTSQESTDAALKNVTSNNSSVEAQTITDVSNYTSDTNDTVDSESTKNAEIPSNITETTTSGSNDTATALPSNDTKKQDPEKKGKIGIGQRLTSEQKDDPDPPSAPILPQSPGSNNYSSSDLMNYTSSAIYDQKDKTTRPADTEHNTETSPEAYVSNESQEPPKVEEVKIKDATEDSEMTEKGNSTDEKGESSESTPKNEQKVEDVKNQKKNVAERAHKADKVVSSVASNKTFENEDDNDSESEDGDDDYDEDGTDENVATKHNKSNEGFKVALKEEEEEDDDATASVTEGPKSTDVERTNSRIEDDRVKMFFISPYEERQARARQILTYPATTGHGWGQSHQFGPAHIWNSDYPYYAYGYSWGCGGGNKENNNHGMSKRSTIKSNAANKGSSHKGKSKEKVNKKKKIEKADHNVKAEWICRDYMLIPAAPRVPLMNPIIYDSQNGIAREHVHGYGHDVACHDEDQQCKQRQVIGSMAGGSMFGDGMGGLGMGFPGVPGIHAGLSGYNAMGGLGDHQEEQNCEHGACGYHDQHTHGGHGGGGGYGGGYGDGEGYGDSGGGGRGYGMNRYATAPSNRIANVFDYQQPSFEYVVPRVIEVGNSVKKSFEPATEEANYEDAGEAGNTQYAPEESQEVSNEKLFHKFSSPSGRNNWDNVELGRTSNPKSEYNSWNPRRITEHRATAVLSREDNAITEDKAIENAFRASDKDLQLNKEYMEAGGQKRTNIYPPEADYGQSIRNLNRPPMIVEESQNTQAPQKMSEIERMVHDVSDSIDKTNKKLEAIKSGKRQITPAFTPVVSEPAAVPDIRYPVPAADRYPLGAGYIWPSANYGHQYGGPYAWSKSSTPKKEDNKGGKVKSDSKVKKSKTAKKSKKAKITEKENKHTKNGSKKQSISHATKKKVRRSTEKRSKIHKSQHASKRQYLSRPYGQGSRSDIYNGYRGGGGGMSMYGNGGMGYSMSHGSAYGGHAGQERAFARHFHPMGEASGGGYGGGGYTGGFQGGLRHRIHSAHSFMPTLSGRYGGFATHEAGGFGSAPSMGGGFSHHMSMFGGGGGSGGAGGGGGGYDDRALSGGMVGGHDTSGFMGGHDSSGFMVGHESRGADPFGGGGRNVDGGYGSSPLSGELSSFTHGMGGGMLDEHQGQESSQFAHGYGHSMQYGMPSEGSHSGYGSSRHSVYGGSLGGPVPGGFELPTSLGGGGGNVGNSVSSLVGGGSLEQSIGSTSSHSIEGGYLGSASPSIVAAAGYGRQSSGMEQQPDPTAADPSSFYGQAAQMVGGSPQAMYIPSGVPIPTYGADIRGMSGIDYGAAAKRNSVPKSRHHKHQRHS